MGLAVMSLLPRNASIPRGQVVFDNKDLVNLPREYSERVGDRFSPKQNERILRRVSKAMAPIRGRRISMVFQEPMTSLNPVLPIGFQVGESIYVHDPAQLARRVLARSKATPELTRELVSLLAATHGDETSVRQFASEHDLAGIEEQALFVWSRGAIHISRKEKAIRALSGQPMDFVKRWIIDTVVPAPSIPSYLSRIPILSTIARRVLMTAGNRKAAKRRPTSAVNHPDRLA